MNNIYLNVNICFIYTCVHLYIHINIHNTDMLYKQTITINQFDSTDYNKNTKLLKY